MKYKKEILIQQRNELTEYNIYTKLAALSSDLENKKILEKIAADEKRHFAIWREITGEEVKANKCKIFFYILLTKLL